MNIPVPHDWPDNAAAATVIQQELRHRVRLENDIGSVSTIAGVDCSFPDEHTSRAVISVLNAQTLQPIKTVTADAPTTFPYVPGFLSFREIPVILKALEQLDAWPDLFMVDGAGIAHPRRLGIAAHLGVLLDRPALGVAKSRLYGTHKEVPNVKGSYVPLMDKGDIIGSVLRSKNNCLPLYISPGHRMDQDTALDWVLHCLTTYRLPEPTRIADKISKTKTGAEDVRARQTELSFG